MKERVQPNTEWLTMPIGGGAEVNFRPIDPEIQARMPKETRTFMEVGPFELAIIDIKRGIRHLLGRP